MAKIINNIAKITTPPQVSLAGMPNYIQFESLQKDSTTPEPIKLSIKSTDLVLEDNDNSKLLLTITSLTDSTEHKFYGTTKEKHVNANTFFVKEGSPEITAENLKACLMKNNFIFSNFELSVPFNSNTINITPLGVGEGYSFSITYIETDILENLALDFAFSFQAPIDMHILVRKDYSIPEIDEPKLLLTIKESKSKKTYNFYGTTNDTKTNDNTFLIFNHFTASVITTAAGFVKNCLKKNSFFEKNFEITSVNNTNGSGANIKSLKTDNECSFSITYIDKTFFQLFTKNYTFPSSDTIDGGKSNALIELDVFTNTGLQLGETFSADSIGHQGKYLTTIQKAYFKQPLWFNLNSTFGNSTAYSSDFLNKTGWQDPGTCRDFRFAGYKNDGVNKEPFYLSDVYYVLNGYGRNLDKLDFEGRKLDESGNTIFNGYIYNYDFKDKDRVKPLTKQPTLPHVIGQSQYFNFIASKAGDTQHPLALTYHLYTQSGALLESITRDELPYEACKTINTIKLDIDTLMEEYTNVGLIKVCLSANGKDVSEPQTYRILPHCLHTVKDFAFLNSLGGWSSFGFTASEGTDFSTSANTIFKTQTPDHNISSQIEAVYSKEVKEHFTVQSMPIRPEVAEWLREMSASPAVYELSTKRYVIVDEMKIKYNTDDDLVRMEMKYRYSDSYNGLI